MEEIMKNIIWESIAKRENGNPIIVIQQLKNGYAIKECTPKGEYKTWKTYAEQWDAENDAMSRALRYSA